MLRRLPVAFALVQAGNMSENLLNEIRIIFFISIQNGYCIYEFWKQQNIWTSWLLINLADKIHLRKSDKYVVLSNLTMYYTWKTIKKSYKNNRFKISALKNMRMNNLSKIFKIVLNTS